MKYIEIEILMKMIIKDQKTLENSCTELSKKLPEFERILNIHGFPRMRKSAGGFKSLLKTIVSQQLSVAAAKNIWERVEDGGFSSLKGAKSAEESDLRSVGLSRQKIKYFKSLAFADIKYNPLHKLEDHEVISELTSVKGIGLWTAEIYLMFSMMRSDIFPAGDLALQISASYLLSCNEKLNEKRIREVSSSWSPNRTAAALMLWDYYTTVKNRKGIF